MTPADFLREVVTPNVDAGRRLATLRVVFNAVLTLDALAGIIHAHGKSAGVPEMTRHAKDEGYKNALAYEDDAFKLVRDLAAATKHGELTRNARVRLVTKPSAVRPFTFADAAGGAPVDNLPDRGGSLIFVYIACDGGRPDEIAYPIIERAHAMLSAVVDRLPAP